MRTVEGYKILTFSGKVVDAASGSGLGTNGVPFVFTRTTTGIYVISFDSGLVPINVSANATAGSDRLVSVGAFAAGTFTTNVIAAAAFANGDHSFTCVCRDNR